MTSGGPSGPSGTGSSGGPWMVLIAISVFFLAIVVIVGGTVALRIGPFARPPGTLIVTATPGSDPLPTATRPTTSGGQPSPSPTDSTATPTQPTLPTPPPIQSPGSPLAELLSHVPEALHDSCEPTEPEASVLAGVRCSTDDGVLSVRYFLYTSADALHTTYDERFRGVEIDADSGRCYDVDDGTINATPNRWPAEHGYSIGGEPVGRYLCVAARDGFDVYWTDHRFGILGIAQASGDSLDRLVRFWLNDAGPVP